MRRIVLGGHRRIHDSRIREFAARRKTDGDSRNDTLRVLKRYIARETFSLIRSIAARTGWSDQRIVDLLIACRRHNRRPPKLRADYSRPDPRQGPVGR